MKKLKRVPLALTRNTIVGKVNQLTVLWDQVQYFHGGVTLGSRRMKLVPSSCIHLSLALFSCKLHRMIEYDVGSHDPTSTNSLCRVSNAYVAYIGTKKKRELKK